MNRRRLIELIRRFKQARILVIGDFILDQFIWGDVSRISPEAPIPVVFVHKKTFMLGGALNVVSNIYSLGGKVYACGVVGKDAGARILLNELRKKGIETEGVIIDKNRPTTLKTRIIARHQQVVRVDEEKIAPLSSDDFSQFLDYLKRKITEVDLILIEDYGKGVITAELLEEIGRLNKVYNRMITVDPKEEHFSYYKGVNAITPNYQEALKAVQSLCPGKTRIEKVEDIGKKLLQKLRCKAVLITLGEKGMCLFEKSKVIHIPTIAQEVFDVSGAGDTVIATFSLALCAGATMKEAAYLSNYAAGIVVGKVGISAVSSEELRRKIEEL
ncbi:MAG: D-glycero-beta-D-manno-heptose-7-phosphate kinase [Candidatus Omnitrophota bacterium]|nr:MAG: D-glycero-beta-D-manno-heptose-7-phosphate kinase [Candidatus Omnitrophota bacterium]